MKTSTDIQEMPKCNVCDSISKAFLSKDGYQFWRCANCGLVFVYPQPAKDFIGNKIYSEESGYQGNKEKILAGLKPTAKQAAILRWLSKNRKGRLLDVGCSNGAFMWLARQAGFEVAGVELNRRTATIAKENGLDVFIGFIEDAKFPFASLDYVFMGDLIEHVADPSQLIDKVSELLTKDGKIIIITPNLDCFWSKSTFLLYEIFGIPWSSLTPPHHLYQFDVYNLDFLLNRFGFIKTHSEFFPPTSLKYELGSLHLWKKWKSGKSTSRFIFMILSFGAYACLCGLDKVLGIFSHKDFQMINFYEKDPNIRIAG